MRKETADFKIGDIIEDEIRDLLIINKDYFTQGNRKSLYYKYHCNKCGYECEDGYSGGNFRKATWFSKQQLGVKKSNCACCSGKIIVPNINSIKITNPELVPYFINGDEEKYSVFSNKKVTMKCPFCGTIKKDVTISSLLRTGFSCNVCSKSMSIGERMIYILLLSLNINFKKEFMFESNKYRYDFYLPIERTIIEVNGEQHYIKSSKYFKNNQAEIDALKRETALSNNIKNYIIIDARQSSFEYIKNSIINSELPHIIDLSSVDWNNIHKELYLKSIAKEVCEYWERNYNSDYVELENVFHFSESTLRKYIKLGISVGWCHDKQYNKYTQEYKNDIYKRQFKLLDYSKDCRNNSIPLVYNGSIYFKNVRLCSEHSEILIGKYYPESTIRYKLKRTNTEFEEITKQEFNMAFNLGKQCCGTPFDEQII